LNPNNEKKDMWFWVKVINGTFPENKIEDFEMTLNATYDIFMMNRTFSLVPEMETYVIEANKKGFTKLMHYKLMRSVYHKFFGDRKVFIEYPKKDKVMNKEDIEYISQYFEVSEREAKYYLTMIHPKELDTIRNIYKKIESYNEVNKTKLKKGDV
jgi:hypothetical protein